MKNRCFSNNFITRFIVVAFFSLLVIVMVEWSCRGDIQETLYWIQKNVKLFLLNYFLLFLLALFITSLISNLFMGLFIYSCVVFVFVMIEIYKMKFLNEPFFPWDLLFVKQIVNLLPGMYKEVNLIYLVGVLVLLLLLFIFRKYLPKIRISALSRLILGFASLLILISFVFWDRIELLQSLLNKSKVENIVWEQKENYKHNGVSLSFILNIPSARVVPPSDYSESNIMKTVSEINKILDENSDTDRHKLSSSKPPNIIYIMNEAFWDPSVASNVSFSQEPIPYYKSYIPNSTKGWLLSPQFGGGTSNVEFEAMTGLSMKYLPEGSIPYQQYIKRPIPSLASVLKERGYKSIAIHTYVKWFWNRSNVYKLFDFDKFIGEEDFVNPEKRGVYIADIEMSKRILNEINQTSEPAFIYAITMQNHSAYNKESKYESSIKVNGTISELAKESLEIYSQGVHDADSALKYLLENINEPTIVVFFGDHLPNLGSAVYDELEIRGNSPLEQDLKLKETPLLIWDNFSNRSQENIGVISPGFIIPEVFKRANLEMPKFYGFLDYFRRYYPGNSKSVDVDSNGQLSKGVKNNLEPIYQAIQYDLLFGKKFSEAYLF